MDIGMENQVTLVRFQVVPRHQIVNPCRLPLYRDLFFKMMIYDNDFENRQIFNYQVAKLIMWIFDLIDVLVKICQLINDLLKIYVTN